MARTVPLACASRPPCERRSTSAVPPLYLAWIGGAHHRERMRDGAASHPPATATAARTRRRRRVRRLLLLATRICASTTWLAVGRSSSRAVVSKFGFTGRPRTCVVPTAVSRLRIEVVGASGGAQRPAGSPGAGARAVGPVAFVLVRKLLAATAAAVLMLGSAAVAKADTVTDWNATFLDAAAAAKLRGPESARIGAVVQAAVYDAVNGVARRYTPYRVDRAAPSSASADAAAAGAAYTALVALIPSQRPLLDQRLNATLAGLATASGTLTRPVAQGLEWGRTVAKAMLAWRARDGIRTKEGTYVVQAVPGGWQPTSRTPGPPVDRQFATLTPFALTSPSQFTPPAALSVAGRPYARDQAEVQALGSARSDERTPRETRTALFWHADLPIAMWNRAADGLIATERTSLPDSARLLALLNIALADTTIGTRHAQSADDFWRPVTAITTTANAAWTPLLPSPDVQEYPSADAALASAAATVLASLYGERTSFVVASGGAVRRFTSFSSAVRQVEASEIYAGIDFRFSCQAGARLGDLVARYSVSTLMRSTRR